MAVDPVTTAASNPWANAAATTKDADKAGLNYDSFLKLLIAQMKNQDPTDPMDASEQMSQLASFSQVEQSVQMNSKLDDLLKTSALSQAGGLVGREIVSADGETTGTVKEVRLVSDGVVAVLESGEEITVGDGVVVR